MLRKDDLGHRLDTGVGAELGMTVHSASILERVVLVLWGENKVETWALSVLGTGTGMRDAICV